MTTSGISEPVIVTDIPLKRRLPWLEQNVGRVTQASPKISPLIQTSTQERPSRADQPLQTDQKGSRETEKNRESTPSQASVAVGSHSPGHLNRHVHAGPARLRAFSLSSRPLVLSQDNQSHSRAVAALTQDATSPQSDDGVKVEQNSASRNDKPKEKPRRISWIEPCAIVEETPLADLDLYNNLNRAPIQVLEHPNVDETESRQPLPTGAALTASSNSSVSPLALSITSEKAKNTSDFLDRQIQINQAVAGFELLLREALKAANETRRLSTTEDIQDIIDSAAAALDGIEAQIVPPKSHSLVHGDIIVHHSSDSEMDIYTSLPSSHTDESDQSLLSTQSLHVTGEHSDRRPQEDEASMTGYTSTNAQHGSVNRSSHSISDTMTGSTHRLYQPPSAASVVRDFAFLPPENPNQGQRHKIVSSNEQMSNASPNTIPPRTSKMQYDNGQASLRQRQRTNSSLNSDRPNLVFERSSPTSRPPANAVDSSPRSRSSYGLNVNLKNPRQKHISLRDGQGFSLGKSHKRRPIAREWQALRKRITASVACFNTVFIGLIAGIYAGEVPRIQYMLADLSHQVILGNVMLFIGLALTTILFWPLPLLHGRKPYTLLAFTIMLPLQFPQALSVASYRGPNDALSRCGLLISRFVTGLALGFANINQLPTLMDLFGASMMHERPHEEIVVYDDVRRQGGGIAIWLGIWSFCFVGSLSIGFCIGACIIATLSPDWGFYIVGILLAFFLMVNVVAPETRRAPYRRSITHFFDEDDKMHRRVARGEVRLHISNDGPKWWFDEVSAGIILSFRMIRQPGFFVLMVYTAWIYCQIVVVVLLLGALLSRDYLWRPQYVGLAVLSLTVGALCATPLTKASLFSRARYKPPRTDSMTMQPPHFTWTSHLVRRCIFTFLLPFAGLAYTLASSSRNVQWVVPVIFAGVVGFLSNLAMAECIGLIMESFDTCDLQPGVNQRHRLPSMASDTRRRRTNYSAFPRVCAGFFSAQSLGFLFAAAGTGASGRVTRALGAQTTTAIVAAILLVLTVFLMLVLLRFKRVQVIPTTISGSFLNTELGAVNNKGITNDPDWVPVVIGNPSGKMRRVNMLELGALSRWTEIRKLNNLIPD